MDDSRSMSCFEPPGSLIGDVERPGHGEWSLFLDHRRQVNAFDVFHHQKMDTTCLIRIVGGDDIRVVDPCRRLHFPFEACDGTRPPDEFRCQNLNRDHPIHDAVSCLENLAHTASADSINEQILTEHQSLSSPLHCLAGLETGQLTQANQLASHRLDRRLVTRRRDDLPKSGAFDNAAILQLLDELNGGQRHRASILEPGNLTGPSWAPHEPSVRKITP